LNAWKLSQDYCISIQCLYSVINHFNFHPMTFQVTSPKWEDILNPSKECPKVYVFVSLSILNIDWRYQVWKSGVTITDNVSVHNSVLYMINVIIHVHFLIDPFMVHIIFISFLWYEGNSISKLQIQVATYIFELSAGNCHR